MSTQALGPTLDIHGGGADLTFPHHENEIAQSEGATGHPFVRYWMHNGFVRINDEKMSKSLGNFFTVREILEDYRPEEVRYFILTSQYRSPLNFDRQHLDNARAALTRFYTALRDLPQVAVSGDGDFAERFHAAMQDDFNTPEALAALFDLTREINRVRSQDEVKAAGLGAQLRQLGGLIGLLQGDPEAYLKGLEAGSSGLSDAEIDALIAERLTAKAQKNWGEADRIRDLLKEKGILLEDAGDITRWRRNTG
jgi:cysteinyl-tRNA synthetase